MKTHLPPVNYYRYVPMARAFIDGCIEQYGQQLPSDSDKVYPILMDAFATYYPFVRNPTFTHEQVTILMTEGQCLNSFYRWWQAGRNIFVFTDELIDSFLKTDVDDVPCDLIRLPYTSCYLKFGNVTDIQTIPGLDRYLDGAYLHTNKHGGMIIELTQCSKDGESGSSGQTFYLNLTKAETVGEALVLGLQDLREQTTKDKSDPNLGSMATYYAKTEINSIVAQDAGYELYKTITRLIVNCLAFIHFEKADIKDDYLGAPDVMVNKLENSHTEKENKRNISKLYGMGFSKVQLCGQDYTRTLSEETRGDIRPHWRRGHWRRQPCGPQLSIIRLTFVRPTIVRADKGMPETGHIYQK